jgi:hypothetical protein
MKLFSVEYKTLDIISEHVHFNLDKIQQEIISKVGDGFIFYRIILINLLAIKNSLWWLIHTRTLSFSRLIVYLTVNISQ